MNDRFSGNLVSENLDLGPGFSPDTGNTIDAFSNVSEILSKAKINFGDLTREELRILASINFRPR